MREQQARRVPKELQEPQEPQGWRERSDRSEQSGRRDQPGQRDQQALQEQSERPEQSGQRDPQGRQAQRERRELQDQRKQLEVEMSLAAGEVGASLQRGGEGEARAQEDAREHFLRNIRQMANNAVLLQRHEDGRIEPVFVSEEFAAMMECSVDRARELMTGMSMFKTTNPADRPLVRSILRHRVAYDGGSVLTIQKITARNSRVWCNVHYAFIDDFQEHYIYCTYTDVTVLKAHELRLRSIYANLGSSFYRENEKTLAIFRANLSRDSFEEIRGRDLYDTDSQAFSYMEVLRQRASHFLIPSERQHFLHIFDRDRLSEEYLIGKAYVSQVLFSLRKDGRSCFVNFSASITRHPLTGDIVAFLTEQECNSEKVKGTLMDKILARQFDMVAYLVDGQYGVTIGEAAQVKRGGIFPASDNGDYGEYLSGQVLPVLSGSEEEKREAARALSLSVVGEQVRIQEPYVVNIAINLEGEIFYKRFDFYSIDPEARFYILLKSDTTEIQRQHMAMNAQLRMALEAANQANVAKTAFLSSMSHEIRTPMNAIIGLDSIALRDPDISERTRDHLEKIGASARHLLGLINDILDMSRIESGRMTIKSEEFSFSEMLEQINTMLHSQCEEKGLSYDCQVIGHVDDYYIGDAMKLKQVLINILGNAVKFTPSPGEVRFLVERVAEFEGQSTLRFLVQDTGIGMDPSYLPRIFDAFSQEDASKTNKYGSTGLGMAITKSIVELMNGNISVESEKGVGTTFTVRVTLRNSSRQAGEAADLLPQEMKVLVVDDDPVAAEHARIVLEELGIQADICLGGKEALEKIELKKARREIYTLILVDWKMPEQDGVEVTRAIRHTVGSESAVIVLTAYNWDEIEEEAVEAGVDSFMPKPLFASTVLSAFRQAMSQKRAAENQEQKEPADLAGRRVLLAEDVMVNAEIMKELLSMMEMEADHAENGRVALDKFAQSPEGYYDAVLMDVRMPVMDGLEAAEQIRNLPRSDAKTVPIIAMTANAFDEDVQRSLQAGMDAHLSKPVEPDRLFRTLGEMIGRSG